MRRRTDGMKQGKRAVYAGLFLGVLIGTAGCVRPTVSPESTPTPVPVPTGDVLPTPVEATPTPVPYITEAVPTSEIVSPTPELLPTPTPEPTEEPVASPTPEVISPTPEPTPVPTVTPEATASPEPTMPPEGEFMPTPEAEPTATPEPVPTELPAYDTLLDNGWQRTEDFFGCREIFFSGMFYDAELIAKPGRYEYRYTAVSREGVFFSVIGEPDLTVQQFLDELQQQKEGCLIEPEGADEYRYFYAEGDTQVSGRVYACKTENAEHRMRVELHYPAETAEQTEGYDFYLR